MMRSKLLKRSILSMLALTSVLTSAWSNIESKERGKIAVSKSFKVIGYLRANDVASGKAAKFDFRKITHLNIAFLNPDSNGVFRHLKGLKRLVAAAHAKNVKVLGSIGGGTAPEYYTKLLADRNSRIKLIGNLLSLTSNYRLDGIDVDLEGHLIDANYETFVVEVNTLLKPKGKLLTSAIATVYARQYTDRALAQYDFLNIMSYDKTGPWKPDKPGQHSPYAMAVEDLNYWNHKRGIAKDRLVFGLPLYGYGFGRGVPEEMSFSDIVKSYPQSKNNDQLTVAAGGTVYYKGIVTIKDKTTLALQQAGGVMLWQLLQDAEGSDSLLNTIHTAIKANSN